MSDNQKNRHEDHGLVRGLLVLDKNLRRDLYARYLNIRVE